MGFIERVAELVDVIRNNISIIQKYKSELLIQIDICRAKNESLKKAFTNKRIEENV